MNDRIARAVAFNNTPRLKMRDLPPDWWLPHTEWVPVFDGTAWRGRAWILVEEKGVPFLVNIENDHERTYVPLDAVHSDADMDHWIARWDRKPWMREAAKHEFALAMYVVCTRFLWRTRPAVPVAPAPPAAIDRVPTVYFVQAGKRIKIGFSGNVSKRIKTLSTASADELVVLATIAGDELTERSLHERFASLRIRGEWFRAEEPLLSFIGSIVAT